MQRRMPATVPMVPMGVLPVPPCALLANPNVSCLFISSSLYLCELMFNFNA